MEIKAIFFDIGWTLLRPTYGDWMINDVILKYAGEKLGSITKPRLEAVLSAARIDLDRHAIMRDESEEYEIFRDYYSALASLLPELGLTREQTDEIAYSKVYNMENYIYYPDAKPTLESLRGRYRLGAISDTWPSIEPMLRYGGIDGFFDTLTFSCFVGVCKPDKRIYQDALDKMELPPAETLFIDDIEGNLAGAEKCGMNCLLITQKPNTPNKAGYPSISCLSELPKYLESYCKL